MVTIYWHTIVNGMLKRKSNFQLPHARTITGMKTNAIDVSSSFLSIWSKPSVFELTKCRIRKVTIILTPHRNRKLKAAVFNYFFMANHAKTYAAVYEPNYMVKRARLLKSSF